MSLEKKLKSWKDAGIIDENTSQSIITFEKTHNNGLFWRTGFIIASLLIGLGICLLIAANWDLLSSSVRIVADFILFSAIVAGAYYNIRKGKKGLSELFLLLSFTMTGGTIGLLAQEFNLDGGWQSFALSWAALSLPYALLSKSVLFNGMWLFVLISGCRFGFLEKIFDYVNNNLDGVIFATFFCVVAGFALEKLNEQTKKYVVMPYSASKLFYLFAYIFAMFFGGGMGLNTYMFSGVESTLANLFVFMFLGFAMWWGIKTQNVKFFKKNAILTEIYIFILFASRMGDLFYSGFGFIAGGLCILLLLYCLRKTSSFVKNMEAFK